jgi:tRNA pseudouridine55 synthase
MVKRYRAVVRFGIGTDTDDPTGTVTGECRPDVWPGRDHLQLLAAEFVGRHAQRPPAFSAKHVAGTRAHKLARQGQTVDLPDVAVQIHAIELLEWSPPDLVLEATVGRGTYLRAVARDLGGRAGIPAHCATLRRLGIGPFHVDDAIAALEVTPGHLMSPAQMVPELIAERVDDAAVRAIGFGRRVAQHREYQGTGVLLAGDGRLLAAAEGRDGWWHPVVVFEPSQ